jgi:hypothetical protein
MAPPMEKYIASATPTERGVFKKIDMVAIHNIERNG